MLAKATCLGTVKELTLCPNLKGDLLLCDGNRCPVVTVGMPVFNGEATLDAAIQSVLSQSFPDFELILSDNCSTDGTQDICERYAQRDSRICYVRQTVNIGAVENFEFVRARASGKYFMWAAADDLRPADFLAANIAFLESNPDYVASTSPQIMEGQEEVEENIVRFSATGSAEERFASYFAPTVTAGRRYRNCWKSHGIFYSVIRRDVLLGAPPLENFLAMDWAFDLYLLSRGSIHRTNSAPVMFGVNGASGSADIYALLRTRWVEVFLPFFVVSAYALSLTRHWTLRARARLFVVLADLNLRTTYGRLVSQLRAKFRSFP